MFLEKIMAFYDIANIEPCVRDCRNVSFIQKHTVALGGAKSCLKKSCELLCGYLYCIFSKFESTLAFVTLFL